LKLTRGCGALWATTSTSRYIETLARRGYLWIAGVEWVESGEKPEISKPTGEIIDSIAVLPFANHGGDPEQDLLRGAR
jgi:DNA-binding winged helix-turn-helix (wHTH) protein